MKIKVSAIVYLDIDTEEYHIPADLNLKEQLVDDISDAIEEKMSVSVSEVTVKRVIKLNDEEQYNYN